jgi:TrmH family RNA methyltransferase
MSLSPGHRARKAAQSLELIEGRYRTGDLSWASWVQELVVALARDPALTGRAEPEADPGLPGEDEPPADPGLAGNLKELLYSFLPASVPDSLWTDQEPPGTDPFYISPLLADPLEGIRSVNRLRRSLEAIAGRAPADWDFMEPLGSTLDVGVRSVFPGMRAYLEDIRSPFNIGSMFRTADAFGLAEILLSGFSADPAHPRAERSAMGAGSLVAWRRAGLDGLQGLGEVFALELRGQPIDSFDFPERGVVVLGSEELGVSPQALARCTRRVSIPMLGAKGSLNVGVAFGILLDAWRRNLQGREIEALPIGHSGGRNSPHD